jgi:hypothetical protein
VRFAVRWAPNTLSPLHSEVLRIMAATEPAKFAQLAAGLIPREALLTVAQRLPGNLESEDWELMLSVCAAIKQALPEPAPAERGFKLCARPQFAKPTPS